MRLVKPFSTTLVWVLVALALLTAAGAAAGIPVRATYGAQTSGDEPHYLLTALSLADDGDLDVSDERDTARYRPFHEPDLTAQAARRPDGTRVVPHDPLLPALLAAPIALGGWVAAKAALALCLGALAAAVAWTATRRFGVPLRAAVVATLPLLASAPMAAYGSQIYPEIPAALAVTVAVAAATRPDVRARELAVLGSAVTVLPWLSAKYVPVAAALAAGGLVRLWHTPNGPPGARRAVLRTAAFLGALAAAGVAYVLAHLAWYGGLTVYASGDFFLENGGQLSVAGTDPNYLGRSTRLLGLLVGQTFGVAAWQPAWLLGVPALAALARGRPRGWGLLIAPLATGWLVAAFVAATMHGWWFPGRQVVVVLPLAAIALAWWAKESVARLAAVAAIGALGVGSYAALLAAGLRGDLTWVVDFAATPDPWYRAWRLALPDYLDPTPGTWLRHAAWLMVLLAAAAYGWRTAGGRMAAILPPMRRTRWLYARLNQALRRTVGIEVRRARPARHPATGMSAERADRQAEPARPRPKPATVERRPVDSEIDRLLTAPVFIYGSVRSGSTLLRVLLGAHSQLHAPHELHVRRLQVQFGTKLAQKAMAELELDRTELEYLLWDRVLHRELVKSGKRYIVEKTPSNAFAWRRISQCWPDARCIFLLRHPVSVARSWHEASPNRRTEQEATADALKYMNAVQRARQNLPGLTVRYEDLTADPERETRRICEFLGIPWEPEMLEYGDRVNGSYRKGLGDWKDKIRSGRVQPGRALPEPQEIPDQLRELCKAWGYLNEPAPAT